jgi:hypothetical protein
MSPLPHNLPWQRQRRRTPEPMPTVYNRLFKTCSRKLLLSSRCDDCGVVSNHRFVANAVVLFVRCRKRQKQRRAKLRSSWTKRAALCSVWSSDFRRRRSASILKPIPSRWSLPPFRWQKLHRRYLWVIFFLLCACLCSSSKQRVGICRPCSRGRYWRDKEQCARHRSDPARRQTRSEIGAKRGGIDAALQRSLCHRSSAGRSLHRRQTTVEAPDVGRQTEAERRERRRHRSHWRAGRRRGATAQLGRCGAHVSLGRGSRDVGGARARRRAGSHCQGAAADRCHAAWLYARSGRRCATAAKDRARYGRRLARLGRRRWRRHAVRSNCSDNACRRWCRYYLVSCCVLWYFHHSYIA